MATGKLRISTIEKFPNNLVESKLISISIKEHLKIVQLKFRRVGGGSTIIEAHKIYKLRCEELREQNIVDHVKLIDKESFFAVNKEDLSYLFTQDYGQQPSDAQDILIHSTLDSIKRGDNVFLSVEPVYGAWIGLIAGSMTVVEVNE